MTVSHGVARIIVQRLCQKRISRHDKGQGLLRSTGRMPGGLRCQGPERESRRWWDIVLKKMATSQRMIRTRGPAPKLAHSLCDIAPTGGSVPRAATPPTPAATCSWFAQAIVVCLPSGPGRADVPILLEHPQARTPVPDPWADVPQRY